MAFTAGADFSPRLPTAQRSAGEGPGVRASKTPLARLRERGGG